MKAFAAMWRAGVKMLRRDRTLLVVSLGLPLISIFVFGWLFGSNGAQRLELGVVDQDHSALTSQLVGQLEQNGALIVSQGTQDAELQALRAGNRGAVLICRRGLGPRLPRGTPRRRSTTTGAIRWWRRRRAPPCRASSWGSTSRWLAARRP